jgi:hypothetical protein
VVHLRASVALSRPSASGKYSATICTDSITGDQARLLTFRDRPRAGRAVVLRVSSRLYLHDSQHEVVTRHQRTQPLIIDLSPGNENR